MAAKKDLVLSILLPCRNPLANAPKIPRLLLSGRVFTGQAAVAHEEKRAALARFSDPAEIVRALSQARGAGIGGVLTLSEANIVAALKEFRRAPPGPERGQADGTAFQVLPIIPNVPSYVRDATDYGMVGAGLRRLARTGPLGFARAALVGAAHPFLVLRKDFATLLTILFELEMGELRRFQPPAVFLHPTMTDLALVFSNRAFFERYAGFVRRRYGAEPGLVTANFVLLARRLEEWNVPISLVVAPLNGENYLMPGGREAYESALASGRFSLIADRVSTQSPTPPGAAARALALRGVCAAVVETSAQHPDKREIPSR